MAGDMTMECHRLDRSQCAPCRSALLFTLFLADFVQLVPAPSEKVTVPLKEYMTVFDNPVPGTNRHRRIHVSEHYGKVAVGDPPQYFDVVFDTGSGNVVLPTRKCKDAACQKHRRFISEDSRTAVQLAYEDGTSLAQGETDRDSTTITYGTGKLTGEYIRDNVCLGADGSRMCINSNFLGVTQESKFPFIELPFDGIFGLGLEALSAGPNFNFITQVTSNSSIRNPVFAVFLRDLDAEEDSEITFGGYLEERLAEGQLSWLPMVQAEAEAKGYWLVTMRDIYLNGKAMNLCDDFSQNPRCQVAMDTGSSLMMGPRYQVNQLLDALGNCMGQMPSLRFVFDAEAGGTFDMILTPKEYAERNDDDCATAFQPIDLPPSLGSMWVFGQTALRKYYTVYDVKHWRIGVGLAQHSPDRIQQPTLAVPTPAKKTTNEVCRDDSQSMVWSHLPGCKEFSKMGYCTRFPPLAEHYCKLSCELCTLPTGGAVAAQTTAEPSTTPTSDSNSEDSSVSVKGSGFSVVSEGRKIVQDATGEPMQSLKMTRRSWR